MTAARRRKAPLTVTVEQPDKLRHSALLYGPVRAIQPALRTTGTAWQYDGRRHAYMVPRTAVADVMAAIELAGHRVDIPLAGWSS